MAIRINLVIKAKELAKDEKAEELNSWLGKNHFEPAEKVKTITRIYDELNIRKLAEQTMQAYAAKAIDQLNAIPVSEDRKQALREFGEQLLIRES